MASAKETVACIAFRSMPLRERRQTRVQYRDAARHCRRNVRSRHLWIATSGRIHARMWGSVRFRCRTSATRPCCRGRCPRWMFWRRHRMVNWWGRDRAPAFPRTGPVVVLDDRHGVHSGAPQLYGPTETAGDEFAPLRHPEMDEKKKRSRRTDPMIRTTRRSFGVMARWGQPLSKHYGKPTAAASEYLERSVTE